MQLSSEFHPVIDALAGPAGDGLDEIESIRTGASIFAQLQGDRPSGWNLSDVLASTAVGPVRTRWYTNDRTSGQPLIVFVHGGGWVSGTLDLYDTPCLQLAEATHCQVVSIDYSLSPEHPYPFALQEVSAVLEWLTDHRTVASQQWDNVFLIGDSAGANLCVATALRLASQRGTAHISGLALFYPVLCPPTHNPAMSTVDAARVAEAERASIFQFADLQRFWDYYLGVAGNDPPGHAAPLLEENLSGLTPTYLAVASCDVARFEAEAFARRLQSVDVPVTIRHYAGAPHAFIHMGGLSQLPFQAMCDVGTWVTTHTTPTSAPPTELPSHGHLGKEEQ